MTKRLHKIKLEKFILKNNNNNKKISLNIIMNVTKCVHNGRRDRQTDKTRSYMGEVVCKVNDYLLSECIQVEVIIK